VGRHSPPTEVRPDLMTSQSLATQASRPRLVRRVNSRAASRESSVDMGPVGAEDQEPTAAPRRVGIVSV
jgi:hypothetical protein